MATFLLTWNPKRTPWPDDQLRADIEATAAGQRVPADWSTGNTWDGIAVGDKAMLVRQRHDRGIVASGEFVSEIYPGEHWDDSGRETPYADVVVDADHRLPVENLKVGIPGVRWDNLYASGTRVPDGAEGALAQLWSDHVGGPWFHSPEEVGPLYREGTVTRVQVNRYERDPAARRACIRHWGTTCAVCSFDFETRYGPIGRGFIVVHHLKELSTVGSDYQVDAVEDLRPVCPNCHTMLHQEKPALSIAQLKRRLQT